MGCLSKKGLASVLILTMTISCLSLLVIKPVNAQNPPNPSNITINSDGSINPTSAPISQDGNKYSLTGDFDGYLTVEASNIVLDGAGYTVKGIEGATILNTDNPSIHNITAYYDLTNLTVENFSIQGEFDLVRFGINLETTSNFKVINNYISDTYIAIELGGSGNLVSGNHIANTNHTAIQAGDNSVIIGNTIANARGMFGIAIAMSSNSTVIGNSIENNDCGIATYTYGGFLYPYAAPPETSLVYGNNFVNNSQNVLNSGSEGASIGKVANWDNGSIGNYWSDYMSKYPNALEIDHTGIGNTPYVIDSNNVDYHPLLSLAQVNQLLNSFYGRNSSGQTIANSSSSLTQTPIPSPSIVTSTPAIPELSWLVTVPLLLSVFFVAVLVRHRKTSQAS